MAAVKIATGPIALYMRLCGFNGWSSFWNVIYVSPGFESADWLIRHEMVHMGQMARMGKLKFTWVYLYWLVKVGYWRHPMEIEARAAEHPARAQTANQTTDASTISH